MSFFKSKAIVLNKKKLSEKEFIYSIFSYEYGKIDCKKKVWAKEKPLDIWYDINFEIFWKKANSLATIRNIKILHELDTKTQDYATIFVYMQLMNQIHKQTERWIPVYAIYDLVHSLHEKKITETSVILSLLKLKHILGVLPLTHNDPIVQKVLKYIYNTNISQILLLTWINTEIKKKLHDVAISSD